MNTEYDKSVSRAKIAMMQKPQTLFLATVCCALETVADTSIPFAATNGKKLLINPDTFMQLDKEERTFLMAHETLHVAYKHMLRRNTRDAKLWNYATDYVINAQLIDQGFKMIKGGLYDAKYAGMSADEVYAKLVQDNPPLPDNPLDGDIQAPSSESGDSDSPASAQELADLEETIDDIVISAAQICDMRGEPGSVPGDVRRYLEKLTKPKVDWKAALRRFMYALDKSDYSWARPNKRYTDFYLPHMRGEAISKLSFAIDTSGSVSKDEFDQFISEVNGVMKILKPKVLHLMQFDHALQDERDIKNVTELAKVPFKGHGGTNPSVALEAFSKSNSMALIMLTDGYFYSEQLVNPKRPVLWVIFDNPDFQAPFGKVIHIELDRRR